MPTAMVPKIYDPELADENLSVSTEEAHRMVRRLAREEQGPLERAGERTWCPSSPDPDIRIGAAREGIGAPVVTGRCVEQLLQLAPGDGKNV